MLIEAAKKLSPLERFLYWIRERHTIYCKKESGQPKPWTDDEILQKYFFCNVYREADKTTVWFKKNIRDPLKNSPDVVMATIIFRWFNLPSTIKSIMSFNTRQPTKPFGMLQNWDRTAVYRVLKGLRENGCQIFTGAYMINSPANEGKLEAICRRIDQVWKDRHTILEWVERSYNNRSMQGLHSVLTRYEGLGGFMAYEIVCDLRYTYVLRAAPDKLTWCNPGPGAIRGLYRVFDRDFVKGNNASAPKLPEDWTERTQELLGIVQSRFPTMPTFEMREIEHSLCEADKYSRLLFNDGRAKRTYNGRG